MCKRDIQDKSDGIYFWWISPSGGCHSVVFRGLGGYNICSNSNVFDGLGVVFILGFAQVLAVSTCSIQNNDISFSSSWILQRFGGRFDASWVFENQFFG